MKKPLKSVKLKNSKNKTKKSILWDWVTPDGCIVITNEALEVIREANKEAEEALKELKEELW